MVRRPRSAAYGADGWWRGPGPCSGLVLGIGIGIGVLVVFVVPALVRDQPAVAVALAAGVLVVGAALDLALGVTPATTIALLGAVASVLLVTLLVGSIGLVAAVPLTTALAAVVLVGSPVDEAEPSGPRRGGLRTGRAPAPLSGPAVAGDTGGTPGGPPRRVSGGVERARRRAPARCPTAIRQRFATGRRGGDGTSGLVRAPVARRGTPSPWPRSSGT